MSFEHAQRRRFAVATAITVILVPAAFLLSAGDDDDNGSASPETLVRQIVVDGSTESTPDEPAAPPTDADESAVTDLMGDSPVDLLNGDQPETAKKPSTIAIPRLPDAITGPATFSRNISESTGCMVPDAPFRARVTVTNVNNSRKVDCFNNVTGTRPDDEVAVLHADAFLQIGDLKDAPIPVHITW